MTHPTDRRTLQGPRFRYTMPYPAPSLSQVWRQQPAATMHFLDICAVDVIKRSEAEVSSNPRKAALITRLRDLDVKGDRISYLLAFMEKVSDPRSTLSDAELKANIVNDVGCMRRFFVNATVAEPDHFLVNSIDDIRFNPIEQARPAYRDFLRTANDRFGLANPVARKGRFSLAENLVAAADDLNISRQHTVVVLTLARLYGNPAAAKVLKFRPDPRDFDVENVLADVMAIGRFLEHKLIIEKDWRDGRGDFSHATYVTDDAGLQEVLACYEGLSVEKSDKGDLQEIRTSGRVQIDRLLTEVSRDAGSSTDAQDPIAQLSEYDRVCALLLGTPEAPPPIE
jgi:hypothetical protein